ncbi:2-C-methyl-D-erythritol 4-phosphate cytidylyltransferase [Vibrio stylophorae]|uniref:2-C-methyl-D-erythritol 4-phosphate cytidylyltransferase n=1 Tax=Vibrio stylophorae TaxID=659351 RepID=A0ABN8DWE1_9VIBR|nr:2-C-methyl-D-erythritol 4-phosphate cytidylyltransferase [Vibrio stylophorae]CAH0534352.1 2-C-methyl-D-erythritol 4-phosphate cytidylyltransferase [Vibrio stylophorae]
MTQSISIVAVVPAAGIGQRMRADIAKQYLMIGEQTVLEHTVHQLLRHPRVERVVIALHPNDQHFATLPLSAHPQVETVIGGDERDDSVLAALAKLASDDWALVHDAARPCVDLADIDQLIQQATNHPVGGILAMPVRDTMKSANAQQCSDHSVDRNGLWHALTPQLFPAKQLIANMQSAKARGLQLTDEASAFEANGLAPLLVAGRGDNIKITQPEDLALAQFYLMRRAQQES